MRTDPLDVDDFKSHYEDRADEISWARGTLPRSGVFLADGRYHVAPYHSLAARRLVDGGALLVASVSFDGLQMAALTGGGRGSHRSDVVAVEPRAAVHPPSRG